MKIYTIEDFNNFEVNCLGYKICPSGDYTNIKHFEEDCMFGERCKFGNCCSFGKRCSFGNDCRFGERCNFGDYCSFGEGCVFRKRCRFGEWCSFGEICNLENSLYFENLDTITKRVIKIDRIGSRKGCTYFFKTENEIYVRCGCFFGTINEFEEKVNETHKNNEQYKKEYMGAINYIKLIMREEDEKELQEKRKDD